MLRYILYFLYFKYVCTLKACICRIYVCVSVYMYICQNVCVYLYIYIYVYVHLHVSKCSLMSHLSIYVSVSFTGACIRMYLHTDAHRAQLKTREKLQEYP